MSNERLLLVARRLEKLACLLLLARKKRKRKRKDMAGSIADGLDVTPGVGGDAGGDGGGDGGGGGP